MLYYPTDCVLLYVIGRKVKRIRDKFTGVNGPPHDTNTSCSPEWLGVIYAVLGCALLSPVRRVAYKFPGLRIHCPGAYLSRPLTPVIMHLLSFTRSYFISAAPGRMSNSIDETRPSFEGPHLY